MKKITYHISRIGLGITFLWIGILIFRNPLAWGSYMQTWAANLLPIPLAQVMLGVAMLDIIIGACLLLNVFVWFVSFIGFLHIAGVLIVSGITDITVRDIAIAACVLALMVDTLPDFITRQLPFLK